MTLAVRYISARILGTAPAEPSSPGPGEVELAPAFVGICGTDLHIFHGDMDARVAAPAVLGHEMSGRVVRVGPGVEGWQPGDAVTVMPLRWDDTCPACRAGHQHICQHLDFIGIDSPGAVLTVGICSVPSQDTRHEACPRQWLPQGTYIP
jgi:threonine dehydrogenase-like Zn-dependent dehydrogenase